MLDFMKDIKELANTEYGEKIVSSYNRGLVTLPEAVEKMYTMEKIIEICSQDEDIMKLVNGQKGE